MFQPNTEDDQAPAYAIGLDASLTSFGVYCRPINHEEWYAFTVTSTAKDGSDAKRAVNIAKEITDTLEDLPFPIRVVGFEDYGPVGRTAGKITARAEMCGIIKAYALVAMRVPIVMAVPGALKVYATGDNKASKEKMVNTAFNQGFAAQNNDEADAYFAAQLAQAVLNNEKTGCAYVRVNPD